MHRGYYVGVCNSEDHPGLISGPFARAPQVMPGHYLYWKEPGASWRRVARFNRWDVLEAWFVWLCSHHDGHGYPRSDPKWWSSYGRLSMMTVEGRGRNGRRLLGFSPRYNLTEETLTSNGRAIYDQLCRRCGFCDCLTRS